ncbi:MAG: arginine deiminase [Bacillota bacterium]
MNSQILDVKSEIGQLKKVLLHRPGRELERLTPELLKRLLFDDIPYLKAAVEEHSAFADLLRENGAEVIYLENLMVETLKNTDIKEKFIDQFLAETDISSDEKLYFLKNYLKNLDVKKLVLTTMEGLSKEDIPDFKEATLGDMAYRDYPFLLEPMPNLYFCRDPFAVIGSGISINRMSSATRKRETIYAEYIFRYHPVYSKGETTNFYSRYEKAALEGGDILILNDRVIAVGISQRSRAEAVEKLAKNILREKNSFNRILVFKIPNKRAFMHLDTVFTMVDFDKFTIHAEIEDPLKVFSIKLSENNELKISEETASLADILKKYLHLDDVKLIRCAGGNYIDARREQWSDGSNTLAFAPGEVIVYERNYVTNRLLEENGVIVHTVPSSELSRGRGGPRCMTMPLVREDVLI